jgi:hypothetical protein
MQGILYIVSSIHLQHGCQSRDRFLIDNCDITSFKEATSVAAIACSQVSPSGSLQ